MAVKSSSSFHALRPRKSCFTLLHIFSIGFKSGLYPGKKSTHAPRAAIACCAVGDLCARKLSITTTSPSFSAGARLSFTYASKVRLSNAPANTRHAVVPSRRMEGSMVTVFQRPSGGMVEAPLAHRRTTVQARHIRFCAAFVQKHQMPARRFILHPVLI